MSAGRTDLFTLVNSTGSGNSSQNISNNKQIGRLLTGPDRAQHLTKQDSQGRTPLFFVRTTAIAQLLIERNADPYHRDKEGDTPLMAAASERLKTHSNQDTLKALVGAKVTIYGPPVENTKPDIVKIFELDDIKEKRSILKNLKTAGLDFTKRDQQNPLPPPLHTAVGLKEAAVIRYLVEECGVSLDNKDNEGRTVSLYPQTKETVIALRALGVDFAEPLRTLINTPANTPDRNETIDAIQTAAPEVFEALLRTLINTPVDSPGRNETIKAIQTAAPDIFEAVRNERETSAQAAEAAAEAADDAGEEEDDTFLFHPQRDLKGQQAPPATPNPGTPKAGATSTTQTPTPAEDTRTHFERNRVTYLTTGVALATLSLFAFRAYDCLTKEEEVAPVDNSFFGRLFATPSATPPTQTFAECLFGE